MATVNLSASQRKDLGKGNARKIRAKGVIPASIYRSGNEPSLITIDPNILSLKFEKSGNPNTLVNIQVEGGEEKLCLVKEVQRHPVTGVIRHVDFYSVDKNDKITVEVPVSTTGKAVGIELGGTLKLICRYLKVECKPQDIPATVAVDVSELDIGRFIRASAIPAPENSKIVFDSDFNVVTCVKGKKG
jgi:large subunit ribosomal protein L25